MAGSIYDWEKTAANNATSDGDINWQEGQAPSTVNNSARVMMARIAEFLSDNATPITTGGSGNNYTITPSSSISSLSKGWVGLVKFDRASSGSDTMQVNGLPATPAQLVDIQGGTISAGDIHANEFRYVFWDASSSKFVVLPGLTDTSKFELFGLNDLTTGTNNAALGVNSGNGITTGDNNTILGANVNIGNTSNNIALATGDGNVRLQFDGTKWSTDSDLHFGNIYLLNVNTDNPYIQLSNPTSGHQIVIYQGNDHTRFEAGTSSIHSGTLNFSGISGDDIGAFRVRKDGAYRDIWHDSNAASRINAKTEDAAVNTNAYVFTTDDKKVRINNIGKPDFVSGELNVPDSSNTYYSATHGLGVAPSRLDAILICKQADLGYSPGDVVKCPLEYNYGLYVASNNSEVRIIRGKYGAALYYWDGSSQDYIDVTKWKVKVMAWK